MDFEPPGRPLDWNYGLENVLDVISTRPHEIDMAILKFLVRDEILLVRYCPFQAKVAWMNAILDKATPDPGFVS